MGVPYDVPELYRAFGSKPQENKSQKPDGGENLETAVERVQKALSATGGTGRKQKPTTPSERAPSRLYHPK
ncbi:hypothetical protein HYS48_00380 [Candidatus Woesearchaeota archaeon]|nr:hypothetical protein [Candidatus Woesearchaeota archaeon]